MLPSHRPKQKRGEKKDHHINNIIIWGENNEGGNALGLLSRSSSRESLPLWPLKRADAVGVKKWERESQERFGGGVCPSRVGSKDFGPRNTLNMSEFFWQPTVKRSLRIARSRENAEMPRLIWATSE